MERFDPRPDPEVADPDYRPLPRGSASLEGFLNAKVMAEILRRADDPTALRDLRRAAEGLRGVDVGLDTPISYAKEDHSGLEKVYFTTVEQDALVPLSDWSRWRP
jgi:hypothetical protein